MKKKLIGFIILLLVLLLGCCTSSFATIDLELLETQLDTLKTKGLIQYTPKEQNSTYWTQLKNYANNSTYNITKYSIIVVSPNSSTLQGKYFIWLMSNSINQIDNSSNNTGNALYNNWSARGTGTTYQNNFGFNSNGTNYSQGSFEFNLCTFSYVYTQVAINTRSLTLASDSEYGGNYLLSSFDFSLASNLNINVVFNGTSETFTKFSYSRSVNSWLLGDFEIDDEDLVKFTLSRFLNDEYSVAIGGAEKKGNYINNYGLAISSDNRLYVTNVNVFYNQGYLLSIDLNGEFLEDYLIYFVPYGSSVSSGDLISPDVDTNKDLELLQTLDELSNSSEVPIIYDNIFDKPSGEIYGLLGYNDYDNPYGGWIDGLLSELKDALIGSTDVSFSFNLMKHNFTLYSSDFITPDGPIKTFVSGFLVFGFLFYIYKQMAHLYHKLQEGNSLAAVNTVSVDDESVLM